MNRQELSRKKKEAEELRKQEEQQREAELDAIEEAQEIEEER